MPENFNGPQMLSEALQMQPLVQLSFYPFGLLMKKTLPDGACVEYPVDPAQVAETLAAKTRYKTGILNGNTICIIAEGVRRVVVEYRPAQMTGLFLEGSDKPLRVPLPGLLMVRSSTDDNPQYAVFAVKERPTTMDSSLFYAPLPNIHGQGSICWGTVRKVSQTALQSASLAEDWQMFFGSVFTPHGVAGKSKQHRQDIRLKLIELEQKHARRYPLRDLMPSSETLDHFLDRLMQRNGMQ